MANIAIVYTSKYGHTKQYVDWLKEDYDIDVYSTNTSNIAKLLSYKLVIFASGVYNDKLQIMEFFKKHYSGFNLKRTMVLAVTWSTNDSEVAQRILQEENYPNADFKMDVPIVVLNSGIDHKKISIVEKASLLRMQAVINKREIRTTDDINTLSILKGYSDMTDRKNLEVLYQAIENFFKAEKLGESGRTENKPSKPSSNEPVKEKSHEDAALDSVAQAFAALKAPKPVEKPVEEKAPEPEFEIPEVPVIGKSAPVEEEFEIPEVPVIGKSAPVEEVFEIPEVPVIGKSAPVEEVFEIPEVPVIGKSAPVEEVFEIPEVPVIGKSAPVEEVFEIPEVPVIGKSAPVEEVFEIPEVPVIGKSAPVEEVFEIPEVPVIGKSAPVEEVFEIPEVPVIEKSAPVEEKIEIPTEVVEETPVETTPEVVAEEPVEEEDHLSKIMAEIERKRKERQAPVLKRPSAAKKDSSRNSYMDLFSTKKVEDTPAIEEPVAPAIVETAPVEVEEVIDEVFDEIIDIAPPTEVVEEVQEIQEIEEVAPVIEEIPAVNEEIAEEIIVPTEVIEEVIETPVEEPEEEFGDLDFSFDTKSKSVPKIVRDANKAAEKKADERPVDADDFFGTKKTKELSIGDGTIDKPEVSIEIADILDDELFDLSQRDSEEDENPSGKAILSAFDYDDGTEDRIAAQINMGAQSFIQLQEDVEDSLEYSKKRRGKKDAKPAYRIIQPTDADDFFRRPRQ